MMDQRPYENIKKSSTKIVKYLAAYNDLYCISIYLPKKIGARNALNKFSDLLFEFEEKNKINEIEGLNKEAIHAHLTEFNQILSKRDNLSVKENLGIFLSKELTKVVSIDQEIPFKTYVNRHFYIKYLAAKPLTNSLFEFLSNRLNKSKKIIDIDSIVKKTFKGKVKILLVDKEKDIYGEYDEQNDFVFLSEKNKGTSLTNIAIRNALLHDAEIIYLDCLQSSNLIKALTY